VRTLLLLIRRFRNLLLFLLLEIIAIILIVQKKNIQGADILSSSNAIAGYLYKKKSDITYYFHLKEVNADLVEENTTLRNQLAVLTGIDTYQMVQAQIPIFRTDSVKVIDTVANLASDDGTIRYKYIGEKKVVQYSQLEYLPASVINSTINNTSINYITINRGEQHGVKVGMSVVSTNGVVGRVVNTSKKFATVASVISAGEGESKTLKLGVTLNNDQEVAEWKIGHPDHMLIKGITMSKAVHYGDVATTSDVSTLYPGHLPVGTVVRVDTVFSNNTKTATLRLSTNFRTLRKVYVVMNDLESVRKELETNINKTP
jgi:rod shape-determining protein MreC